MNTNEIEDAFEALARIEKRARDEIARADYATEAARRVALAGVRVDADSVRDCIGGLRAEGAAK